ncbi:hypothetical protein J6590_010191 [Homalodisca vitripennis]|nr:hypothetical protein J6590_010191 [Homalodisca vitripennis]
MTLWIFRVLPNQLANNTYLSGKHFDEHTEMAASLPVTLSSLGWQRFELTHTVRQWYDASNQNRLGLLVDCSGCTSRVEAVLFQGVVSDRPYLVVHTESVVTRRVRRRAIDCHGNNTLCCKERFYVSFRELGWDDWIIAPSGYFANYCRGDCGGFRTPDMIASHHAHVIEEYRKMDRLNGMQPCCAPLKFSAMSLIYFGPDMTIIKRDLPKMVVDECGCP